MTSKMARPTSSRAEGTHSGSSTSIKAATDIHISWRTWAVAKPLSSPHLISEAPPSFVCYGGGGCRRKGIYILGLLHVRKTRPCPPGFPRMRGEWLWLWFWLVPFLIADTLPGCG